MITQEELKSILSYDPETGLFTWRINASTRVKEGHVAGYVRKRDGYLVIRINAIGYSAHRLAWLYMHGVWPALIDHKDRNRLNNSIGNLREATVSQNGMNSETNNANSSGYRGVTWNKRSGKWQAQAKVNGRNHYLGLFASADQASFAYESFCKRAHGDFYLGSRSAAA